MPTRTTDHLALDLITHSPDGESRGRLYRAGDLFPMSPTKHILSAPDTPASDARPWGLRHRVSPTPVSGGGSHGGGGSNETSDTSNDGNGPNEEKVKD
jgi:hypothetical protein